MDRRSQHGLCQARGGLRERPQGLLQEAGQPAELTDRHAAGRSDQRRQTKDHDHLHH